MQEVTPAIQNTLVRLATAGFEVLPMLDVGTHYIVGRDGLMAFVQRYEDGSFGSSGNPGKLCERGLATFVRRGDGGVFQAKGLELEATPDEYEAAIRFATDLGQALTEPVR